MLRRVENARVSCQPDMWGLMTGNKYKVTLTVGRKVTELPGRALMAEFKSRLARSNDEPVCFGRVGERQYWLHAGKWYSDNEDLQLEQVVALLGTRNLRKEDTLRRARTLAAAGALPTPTSRKAIPKDVTAFVFRRDGGACCECGTQQEIQFDHIIPISFGGSSEAENLQLLCGPCNRRKGASV